MITGEVTAKGRAFAAAVKWAAGFLDARPSEPIQAGLLLDLDSAGSLQVTAMSENVTATATVPIESSGRGKAVVSGRLLKELVATFSDKPVQLGGENGAIVQMKTGRWTGTLPAMDEKDYPALPAVPEVTGSAPGEEFARIVTQAAAATAHDVKPLWRQYIYLTLSESQIWASACDRYRAAKATTAFDHWLPEPAVGAYALALGQPLVAAAAAFVGPDDVEIGFSDGRLLLASKTRTVVMRLIDVAGAEYPEQEISSLLAMQPPAHAVVKVAELAGPMRRASIVREKDGPVAVGFSNGLMRIAAKAEQLEQAGADEVDVAYDGPDVVLHFNPKYFSEALQSAPGDVVDIAIRPELDSRDRKSTRLNSSHSH